MRYRGDVEEVAGAELGHAAVVEGGGRGACEHGPHGVGRAAWEALRGADVLRPPPAWLVTCSPDRHATDVHELEPAELELTSLIRSVEAPEHDLEFCHHTFVLRLISR